MPRMGDVQLGGLAKEQRERRAHPRRGAPAQPSCGWLRYPLPVDKETGRCGFEAERQGIDDLVLFLVVVALVLIVGILLAPLGAGIAVVATLILIGILGLAVWGLFFAHSRRAPDRHHQA